MLLLLLMLLLLWQLLLLLLLLISRRTSWRDLTLNRNETCPIGGVALLYQRWESIAISFSIFFSVPAATALRRRRRR